MSKESASPLAELLSSDNPGDYLRDYHNLLGETESQLTKAMTALKSALPVAEVEAESSTNLQEVADLVKISLVKLSLAKISLVKIARLVDMPPDCAQDPQAWVENLAQLNLARANVDQAEPGGHLSQLNSSWRKYAFFKLMTQSPDLAGPNENYLYHCQLCGTSSEVI